jgi:hypothetical protein
VTVSPRRAPSGGRTGSLIPKFDHSIPQLGSLIRLQRIYNF